MVLEEVENLLRNHQKEVLMDLLLQLEFLLPLEAAVVELSSRHRHELLQINNNPEVRVVDHLIMLALLCEKVD